MSYQTQVYKDTSKFTLGERSDIANVLKAPYTVFAKKHNESEYSWIVYSLGRPQNVVWGMLQVLPLKTRGTTYKVEYGCRYKSVKVINDMLAIKKRAGYHLVATLARDRDNTTLLGHFILEAYLEGKDLVLPHGIANVAKGAPLKKTTMSYRDMDLALLDICDERGLNYAPEKCELTKAVEILAESFLNNPNLSTRHKSPIPDAVVDSILDFIAHTPKLNEQMLTNCYTVDECKRSSKVECGLYHQEDEMM